MQLEEISSEEYKRITDGKGPVFCSQEFLELNKKKVDKVRYLLGRDKKDRIAFALGEKGGQWNAPYSAPYASFIEIQKSTKIGYFWDFVNLLNGYARQCGVRSIDIFLPPDIYCRQINAKTINALLGNGYHIAFEDVNYSLNLMKFDLDRYGLILHSNAKKNLNIALKSDLSFFRCEDLDSKKEAYKIICTNRKNKGYPLRMTLGEVLNTIKVIEHDFFLVQKEEVFIASAVVFHVADGIVQVIYWGDIPDVGAYKPMNFLSYQIIRYYKKNNIEQIDIGPSSESGMPNLGLCNFKESIGCEVSSKYRMNIQL